MDEFDLVLLSAAIPATTENSYDPPSFQDWRSPSAPRGIVLQQDHQVEAVFINQRLHKRVFTSPYSDRRPGVLTKSVMMNATRLAYFTAKSIYCACLGRNFIVIRILERHLIAAEMRKTHNPGHIPRRWWYWKILASLLTSVDLPLDSPPRIATVRTKNGFTFASEYIPSSVERVLADLPAANIHKGPLRIDKHRLDPQMLKVLRRIGLFRGIRSGSALIPFFASVKARIPWLQTSQPCG